ncbi:PspC domain-containing protein [Rudaeicoccus suwonensis]|uniref:Phage shock protein C (PspC) family protein n=1 Tax=Rudaeicoccus suwonensis TaxID=657409 RepID=A0A561E8H0_9MICO|nr:PspC domain-containing protein [Rudaeicoccus suwonensis]TWE11918.1 phage shock protein C (PspC) family protein [Rudaeicoccus suwonensis]
MTQQTHQGAPAAGPQARDALGRLFAACRNAPVVRQHDGRWCAGVCAGAARRWDVDPLIVRAGFVLATFMFGLGIPVYLLAWCLLPDESGSIVAERAVRRGDAGAVLLTVISAIVVFSGFGFFWSGGWGWSFGGPVIGIVLLAWIIVAWSGSGPGARHSGESPEQWLSRLTRQVQHAFGAGSATAMHAEPGGDGPVDLTVDLRKSDRNNTAPDTLHAGPQHTGRYAAGAPVPGSPDASAPPVERVWLPPRPRRATLNPLLSLAIAGVAMVTGACSALILTTAGRSGSALQVGLGAGIAVAAVGLILGGLAGRRGGGLASATRVAAVLAVASLALPTNLPWTGPIGDQHWQPTSVAAGQQRLFAMRVGQGTLDLRDLKTAALESDSTITARVNIGQLVIIPPIGARLVVHSTVDAGSIDPTGATDSRGVNGNRNSVDNDQSGLRLNQTTTIGSGTDTITVDARVGIGQISIGDPR